MWFVLIIMISIGKEEPSQYYWRKFLIFLAAESKKGMFIFLLGGTTSLSQALPAAPQMSCTTTITPTT